MKVKVFTIVSCVLVCGLVMLIIGLRLGKTFGGFAQECRPYKNVELCKYTDSDGHPYCLIENNQDVKEIPCKVFYEAGRGL